MLAAAGITTILVTHDQAEALAFADQLAVMRGGRFAQVGIPRDVNSRPVDAATAAFLGEAVLLPSVVSKGQAQTPLGLLSLVETDIEGRATILLRPEQMSVRSVGPDDGNAVITDLVFGGSTCEAVLLLDGAEAFTFRLDIPNREPHAIGDRVAVEIFGAVHAFR